MISGFRLEELYIGDAAIPVRGARVTVRYTGYLNGANAFQTGAVQGGRIHVGVRRRLRVGRIWAQREQGVRRLIPPNAKLVFEVELLVTE